MKIDSREYKVVIDGGVLANVAAGLARLLEDISRASKEAGLVVRKAFDADDSRKRFIRFLDTAAYTLRENDLLLRQRIRLRDGKTEYTLKCRSADRYIAAAKSIDPARAFGGEDKFEDDIGPPFVSRLSHSATVIVGKKLAGNNFPTTLAAAGKIFPGVLEIASAGRACSPKTKLRSVSDSPVFERVFEGPEIRMPGKGRKIGPVAVILWTRGEKGKVLIAELSFRHEKIKKKRIGGIAPVAKHFFGVLQRQPWARPKASGKTEFMYQRG